MLANDLNQFFHTLNWRLIHTEVNSTNFDDKISIAFKSKKKKHDMYYNDLEKYTI